MELNKQIVDKINELLDYGLVTGVGNPVPGQMCVEAVICNALGLPHGDDPKCVIPSLRKIKIQLNDSKHWKSNKSRAEGLRRLAIAQIGTLGVIDEKKFMTKVARMTIKTIVPSALRSAAKMLTGEHQSKLLILANKCENEPNQENASHAAYAAAYAAVIITANAANAVARAAADAAANAAARAADAAANAAYAAANAAYAAARAGYAADAADAAADAADAADAQPETVLATFAENIVQILIEMKAPACKWL